MQFLSQATVYFLTSTDKDDEDMRNTARGMFAFGAFMVLVQWLAAVGLLIGMVFPSCGTDDQCHSGTYCHIAPGRTTGRCLFCGEAAPLVPYSSDEPWPDKRGRYFKVYNFVYTGSYNKINAIGTRGSTPAGKSVLAISKMRHELTTRAWARY